MAKYTIWVSLGVVVDTEVLPSAPPDTGQEDDPEGRARDAVLGWLGEACPFEIVGDDVITVVNLADEGPDLGPPEEIYREPFPHGRDYCLGCDDATVNCFCNSGAVGPHGGVCSCCVRCKWFDPHPFEPIEEPPHAG